MEYPDRPGDERPDGVRPAPLLERPLPADARRADHRRRSSTRWPSRPDGSSTILLEAIRGAARVEPEGGAAFGQRAATWNASALGIWDDPADRRQPRSPGRAHRPIASAVGSLTGAGYANYAPVDEPIERVRLAFGTERFARLAAIKARYDPDNRFRFNLNIAPGHPGAAVTLGRGRSSVASSGRTSRVSSAPPARATSCWTRSSASPSSFSQRAWSATPRSYRAIAASSG